MKQYHYNTTTKIAEAFDNHNAKYRVARRGAHEELQAGFPVDGGPHVMMKFINCDDGNDVSIRIFGLITKIPEEKHGRILTACNLLNRKVRFVKFYLDEDADVNLEYDLPVKSSVDSVGEMCFEIFIRIMHILDENYGLLMKALYSDEPLEIKKQEQAAEAIQQLEELRRHIQESLDRADADDEEGDGEEGISTEEIDRLLELLREAAEDEEDAPQED